MIKLTGIITALASPFKQGQLDKKSFVRLVRNQLEQGISDFVINGTTGESPCLSERETEWMFSCIKTETGNTGAHIFGVGGNCTAKVLQNIKTAERLKASAVLAVVPYYNKPPQRGLIKHFKTLADNSQLPILLYNVPARTVTELSIDTIIELSAHPKIIGIKSAGGDLNFDKKLIQKTDKDFIILSGDDESCMDLCAIGGRGVISVVSHILGKQMTALFQKIKAGNLEAVQEYKKKYLQLLKTIYCESNPIGIKMALKLLSILESAELRSPLTALPEAKTKKLKIEMQKAGLF